MNANSSVKIISIVAGVLIFASLITDVIVANWWPTIAIVSAMAVAGFFTGINVLARGQEKSQKPASRKKVKK